MNSRWASAVVLLALAAPLEAQDVRELGLQVIGTASDPALVAGGGYAALRLSRRLRLSAGATAGAMDGDLAWRGELLGHFLLAPRALSGLGWYGAAGLAAVGGPVDEGYVVVTLGVESRPGTRVGWFVEAGVGGGARVAAGVRRRWMR